MTHRWPVSGSLTLQFHPDWPHRGRTVIESMAEAGAYRSQFSTGISNGGPGSLEHLCRLADGSGADELDDYVEAHVHGPVLFARDVDAVVLDPAHKETVVAHAAATLGCPVSFHAGFRLSSSDLDPAYRGTEIVDLAGTLGAVLTPAVIGRAARSGTVDLQSLKRVWHYLARFGRDRDNRSG